MHRRGILVAVALLLSTMLWGQGTISIKEIDGRADRTPRRNLIHVAVPLLTIAPDSRAAGMGDLGVATQPDVNSQHWNLAKYALLPTRWGVSLSYVPWLAHLKANINLMYLAGYYRIDDWQAVSASIRYFALGTMQFTDYEGRIMQTHNPNEFAIDLGYSRRFIDDFTGGVAFRFIRSDLTGGYAQNNSIGSAKAGMSYAADVALYYQRPFEIRKIPMEMAFGLAFTNMGSKISYNDVYKSFIPITLRVGGRCSMMLDQYNLLSLNLEASKLMVPTPPQRNIQGDIIRGKDPDVGVVTGMFQSFYDAPGGFSEEWHEVYWGLGLEYSYARQFALRGGYFFEHQSKGGRQYVTLGLGVSYNVFTLDASYLIPTAGFNSPLAHTVRFSLMVNFKKPEKKSSSEVEE